MRRTLDCSDAHRDGSATVSGKVKSPSTLRCWALPCVQPSILASSVMQRHHRLPAQYFKSDKYDASTVSAHDVLDPALCSLCLAMVT
eukprot:4979766-Amphidinium_carterae.1